jgi:predicted Zn-dependent peptidase
MKLRAPLVLACSLASATALLPPSPARAAGDVSIPFTKTTLPNGLTVILSEDHSLPLVTLDIAYRVGSRFEQAHRTGFAHLFEHLMFMGTRRAPGKSFDAWMESAGGWNNAGTSEDHTEYFDVAPPPVLDLLLWLEADRLRDVGPLMTKEKLDLQRDVVRNELRQRVENTPYARAEEHLTELLYPDAHPYHHPVIGSHEDLEAAQVDDVKQFFATYYDPANASLCVVGDFDPKKTMDHIQAWIATIPSKGKPADPGAPGFDPNVTTLKSVVRETMKDQVELAKTIIAWQSPRNFAPGDAELDLLSAVLSKGKESRLYSSLVYEQKLAQEVQVFEFSKVLGSQFVIDATARPGVSLDKLEAAIDAELEKVRKAPLTDEELSRAKNVYEAGFVQRLQTVNARASILNEYQNVVGDPGFAQKDLDRYRQATAAGIKDVAAKVLDPNARVILRVIPAHEPAPPPPPNVKKPAGGATPAAAPKGGAK